MMSNQKKDVLSGYILEDQVNLTLRELCDACAVRTDYIIRLVDEGCIEPTGIKNSHWCFNGVSVKRVQKAIRLQHDLDINLAGVALVIDLMEEIEILRSRLDNMQDIL